MFNETIKTVSTPAMLEAAQREYNKAKRERLEYIQYMNKHKSLLKVQGGVIENTDQYQALMRKERAALAQLEAIRKTQFENVFTEHNTAKGITP